MHYLLSALLCIATCSSFAQNEDFVKGELIVQFAPATSPYLFIRKFEAKHQTGVKTCEELSDIVNIYHIVFTDEEINLDNAAQLLMASPEVNLVQRNHYITNRETIPTDALFATQGWHLKNTGLDGGEVDADIDATDAWDITTGGLTTHGDTVVACIIEGGGVDISHEDLAANIWKNHAEIPDDGIDNDGNGYIDDYVGWNVYSDDDDIGYGTHGTKVAGMAGAAGNNGLGLSGVAWDVKMMIVSGQQASNEATVIEAYNYPLKMRKLYNESYGEQGAFVVVTNSSWGLDNKTPEDSPLWCAMYDSLGTYGILSVGATTNDDDNVDVVGDLPTTCTSDYFIAVTQTNNNDLRLGTGYGTTSVDLGAPGFGIRTPVPGNVYGSGNGTSFSAPLVTGAIALAYTSPCPEFINFVKYNPQEAASQMRDYILDGTDPVPALADDVATGGRLNVNNSIELLMEECDPGLCVPPYNMRTVDISDTSATLLWDGFTVDYVVNIKEGENDPVQIPITGGTSIHLDTLIPCTIYTFKVQAVCGETLSEESYTFTFETDGCCKNPPLQNSLKTEDALTVTWDEILYATQYNMRYAELETDDWTEMTDVTSPLTAEGLKKCTKYEFQIYTVCDDSTRGYSESFIFRTMGCGPCTELEYCPVLGANASLEWIDSVKVNGFENQTGSNGGWLQSNQIITALTPGETYPFRIVPDFAESTFTERYSIFIDFDQNGVFNTPIDRVLNNYSIFGPVATEITIPPTALIGVTKMRIAMTASDSPSACPDDGSFFGEYEDYCVYIGPQLGLEEEALNLVIYPNPANDHITIETDLSVSGVSIFSYEGKRLMQLNDLAENNIDITGLSKGIYIVKVETSKGLITKKLIKH